VATLSYAVVGHCRNHLATLYSDSPRHDRKSRTCRWNYDAIYCSSGGITTSGFGGHIAISGCPSMSHLFLDTFFEFGVVEDFVYRARIT